METPHLASKTKTVSDVRALLCARRDACNDCIASLDKLWPANPVATGKPRGRPRKGLIVKGGVFDVNHTKAQPAKLAVLPALRPGSLKEQVFNVLIGNGPMRVKDITAAVLKAGYTGKNRTLPSSIGIALTQLPGVQKVSRGVYARA